ncbi:MAG: hypothetical protein L3K17_07315 [Thermoplasmata archaeon]|nr:hypothetical protein [Thermoplasmata archaeon]
MRNSRVPLGAIFAVSLLFLGATPLLSAMTAAKADAVPGGSAPGSFDPWADLDPAHSRLVELTLRNVAWSPDQRLSLAQVATSLPANVVRDLLDANEGAFVADLPMGAAHRIAAILPEFASAGIHPLNCIINCAVTAGLLGCAVGIGFGALGGPVGAGVGCVVVGLAAGLGFYFGTQMSAQDSNNDQAVNWLHAEITVLGNAANTTGGFLGNAIQLLNFTQNYFDSRADSAAVFQLGNSTFNVLLDEAQSGTAAQAMDIQWAAAQSVASAMASFQSWYVANFGPNGRFNSVPSHSISLITLSSAFDTYDPTTVPRWVAADIEIIGGSANPQYVYLAHDAIIVGGPCTTTCNGNTFTVNAWPVGGGPAVPLNRCTAANTTCWPNPDQFTGPSGVYNVTPTGNFVWKLLIYGGADIQTASNTGQFNEWVVETANVSSGLYHEGSAVSAGANGHQTATVTFFSNSSWSPGYPNALLIKSAQAAQTYWAFLRALGITDATQIPVDCVIPTPNEVLPPGVDIGNLTIAEYQSLFYGWLSGLATFYDTTLNATNFCGTLGHHAFQLGSDGFWPLFFNVTLAVYVPNATLYPGETYGNVSSWAYPRSQALVTPLLATVRLPVGAPFNIPSNDPLGVFLVQRGVWLTLHGNGTNVSIPNPICSTGCSGTAGHVEGPPGRVAEATVPLASPAAGDAVFLYSCIVGGVPTANCTITVQSINQTIVEQNGTCEPQCGLNPPPGFAFTLPNPFSLIASAFCALLGPLLGPGCAGTVSLVFEVLFVLVVVLAVVWIVSKLWPERRNKRGGSA